MSQIDRTDGLVGNAAIKYPCRMASTANLVLSGLQTIDAVVGAQDDRVLVKNQTTGSQNGIYVMDSGSWERAQDADNDGAFTEGSLVKVNNGTVGVGFWYVTNTGTITIDSTAITFAQASGTLAFISAAWQAVVSLATIALGLTQAGFSAFVQTLLAAATALAFRQLLILDKRGADIASAATPNLDTATGDVIDITGAVSITGFTLTEGVEKTVRFTGALTLTHGASLVLPGAISITTAAGDFAIFRGYAAGVVRCVSYTVAAASPSKVPTRQVFTSGSAATYTTPTGARQIRVRMKGGGGGGAGSGTTGPNNGGTGGTTIFNSINANGGTGGNNSASALPGAGGTGGTGTASSRMAGASGGYPGTFFASATNAIYTTAPGGGQGGTNNSAGVANSGGGGPGGNVTSNTYATLAGFFQGVGGGEGETAEIIINNPAATYTYTVGAVGTAGGAGTSGVAGGAGGTGVIVVDEIY